VTQPAQGLQGRDADGYLVYLNRDEMDVRVTECCRATAKGLEDGIGCRSCYQLIDEAIGGQPVPPYILDDGRVTFTGPVARGWGDHLPGPPYSYSYTFTVQLTETEGTT
jgi:hypothetical protein